MNGVDDADLGHLAEDVPHQAGLREHHRHVTFAWNQPQWRLYPQGHTIKLVRNCTIDDIWEAFQAVNDRLALVRELLVKEGHHPVQESCAKLEGGKRQGIKGEN